MKLQELTEVLLTFLRKEHKKLRAFQEEFAHL